LATSLPSQARRARRVPADRKPSTWRPHVHPAYGSLGTVAVDPASRWTLRPACAPYTAPRSVFAPCRGTGRPRASTWPCHAARPYMRSSQLVRKALRRVVASSSVSILARAAKTRSAALRRRSSVRRRRRRAPPLRAVVSLRVCRFFHSSYFPGPPLRSRTTAGPSGRSLTGRRRPAADAPGPPAAGRGRRPPKPGQGQPPPKQGQWKPRELSSGQVRPPPAANPTADEVQTRPGTQLL
jgi:hypothetical protein